MADLSPYPDSNSDTGDDTDVRPDLGWITGTPRWVKAMWILVIVLVLMVVIMMFGGHNHGPGQHGPSRHKPSKEQGVQKP